LLRTPRRWGEVGNTQSTAAHKIRTKICRQIGQVCITTTP
jgi:hypothetical protein